MTTPQVTTRTSKAKRNAFTLVELMIVIVIIGILVGISSPFIYGALIRTKEFAIQNEMLQLDASIKRFENEHGFYPPAFNVPGGVNSPGDMRRYLNRIAPNHAEGTGTGGDRLTLWWNAVGQNLDIDSGLVFWLSGLCTSKQYPLSGSPTLGQALAPYNADRFIDDSDIGSTIDRNVFFEFVSERLISDAGVAGIKTYNQPHGKGEALAYLYLDSKSYVGGNAYHAGVDGSGNPTNFFNPDTFQIIGPGMDGIVSAQTPAITDTLILSAPATTPADANPEQDDNITNFSNGRLDLVFE